MNYIQCVDYVHNFFKFNKKAGLTGITRLLEEFDNPQDKLKFIHIAGTNGKGSTTAMSSTILKEAGYTVGMFVSPFVINFRERFQVNNEMISEEDLCDIVNKIAIKVDYLTNQGVQIAQFEVVTAIGMIFFHRKKCDIVCLEVGIGGLVDATNVIKSPLVCAITSISFDHTKILGSTLRDIAIQKCGIIKSGTSVVCYPMQEEEVICAVMESVFKNNATFYMPNANSITNLTSNAFYNNFTYGDLMIKTSLAGKHQVYNSLTVIEIMNVLRTKGFVISDKNITKGIANTHFPCRLEKVSEKPLIILDGAHNIGGITALASAIDDIECDKRILIIGMLKDKDYTKSLPIIAKKADYLITVEVDSERSLKSDELKEFLLPFNENIISCANLEEALKTALAKANDESLILICGSLYLTSEYKNKIRNM